MTMDNKNVYIPYNERTKLPLLYIKLLVEKLEHCLFQPFTEDLLKYLSMKHNHKNDYNNNLELFGLAGPSVKQTG